MVSEDDSAIVILIVLGLAVVGFCAFFVIAWVCERVHAWWTGK